MALKYKVGDRVRIKSLDWYYNNRDRIDEVACGNTNFIPDMVKYCEEIVTISSVLPTLEVYHIKEDGGMFNWTDEMFEELVEEKVSLKLTGKAIKNNEMVVSVSEYILPEGYIIKDENGNVINTNKIVFEKKKEYPKTYEECCKVFGLNHYLGISWNSYDVYSGAIDSLSEQIEDIAKKLEVLSKLLLCRAAYWKIAGEEMGLGKPWEPDWKNDEQFKYVIICRRNCVIKDTFTAKDVILTFPTKEMRDAFYENFKELIETVKELL